MAFEDYAAIFPESLSRLLIFVVVLAGAALVQRTIVWYRRICLEEGTRVSTCGLTGELVARRLLAASSISEIGVARKGNRDHFHPWKREIRLSDANFSAPTLMALATAAHEVGHAQQFVDKYILIRLHQWSFPVLWIVVCMVALLPALPLAGISWLPFEQTCMVILAVVVVTLLAQLPIHLPLEYDASRRAKRLVLSTGLLAADEQATFDRLLKAAWLTYAAAEAQRWSIMAVAAVVLISSNSYLNSNGTDAAATAFQPIDSVQVAPPQIEPPINIDEHPVAWRQANSAADTVNVPPIGLFEAILPNLICLVFFLPFFFFVNRLGRSFQPTRTNREQATERNNRGMDLFEKGAYQAALTEFDAALKLDSSLAAAHYNRGQVYLVLGGYDEAAAGFDAALRIEPAFVPALVGRGDTWLKRGDSERALAEYTTAHRQSPQNATVLAGRGFVWIVRGESERAMEDFELALQYNPQEPLAYAGRALVLLGKRELDRALQDCDNAARLGAQDPVVFSTRGRVRFTRGEHGLAIEDFSEALRLDANDASVLRDRGLAWYLENQFDRALNDLNDSIRLDPTDAIAFNNRGAVFMKSGHPDKAAEDFHRSIELDPDFPNPHKHLASLQASRS